MIQSPQISLEAPTQDCASHHVNAHRHIVVVIIIIIIMLCTQPCYYLSNRKQIRSSVFIQIRKSIIFKCESLYLFIICTFTVRPGVTGRQDERRADPFAKLYKTEAWS